MNQNITNIITMTKVGHGTVVMKQGQYSDGEKWYTLTANGIEVSMKSAVAMNMAYKQYLQEGWTVKPAKIEKAVKAPTQPKPKKTREESLTAKYGDKDQRRAYKKAEADFHRYYMLKIDSKAFTDHKDFLKAVAEKTANALQKWDEAGRPAYNC